jgi:DNA phosphorothioation-dependent restriction protein DptG
MPATLVTRTLASQAWEALGGGARAEHLDLVALTAALKEDAGRRRTHSAACAAIAVVHRDVWRQGQATFEELRRAGKTQAMRPGLHALRDEVRRSRSKDLRHQSTDVVNQLMQAANVAGPGSLLARNGRSFAFYEVDEQLLLLLVRLVCRDEQVPFASFLNGLLAYGLAPQDRREQDALADTLERLGLLARYSDAGEASFVHYA